MRIGSCRDLAGPGAPPAALADAGLLDRVLVNLIADACAVSPAVTVRGTHHGDRLALAVIDHGPAAARDAMFAPFQRLGGATGIGYRFTP